MINVSGSSLTKSERLVSWIPEAEMLVLPRDDISYVWFRRYFPLYSVQGGRRIIVICRFNLRKGTKRILIEISNINIFFQGRIRALERLRAIILNRYLVFDFWESIVLYFFWNILVEATFVNRRSDFKALNLITFEILIGLLFIELALDIGLLARVSWLVLKAYWGKLEILHVKAWLWRLIHWWISTARKLIKFRWIDWMLHEYLELRHFFLLPKVALRIHIRTVEFIKGRDVQRTHQWFRFIVNKKTHICFVSRILLQSLGR